MQTRIGLRGDRGTSGKLLNFSDTLCSLFHNGVNDSPCSRQSWASRPLLPSLAIPLLCHPCGRPIQGLRQRGLADGRRKGREEPGYFSFSLCLRKLLWEQLRLLQGRLQLQVRLPETADQVRVKSGYPNLQIDKPRLPAAKTLCKAGRVATIVRL